jgi:hypothetical protein
MDRARRVKRKAETIGAPAGRVSVFRSACLCLLLAATLVAARPFPAVAAPAPAAQRLAQLADDVERAEAIRAVKRLQLAYAHYSQFGLWDEIAGLFAETGEVVYGDRTAKGRAAIGRYFTETFGGGRHGLAPGGMQTRLLMTPVVNLSADGRTAKGRWHELGLHGGYGARADWSGGILVNDYVKEGSVWKIARLHYYPQFAGPYETGWRNLEPDLKVVPYHYTPDQSGVPIPPAAAPPAAGKIPSLAQLSRRIDAMVDEGRVRNLQYAWGYYMDRKMWDDVVDLFAQDATLEIAGVGLYRGPAGVRRSLGRDGAAGLAHGELKEHVLVDVQVTLAPDGRQAWARGIDLGLIGQNGGDAFWSETVFENRFAKDAAGVWRVAGMRLYPKMKADYFQGWAKSRGVDPPPAAAFAPDRPAGARSPDVARIPVFSYPHPVTGRTVRYPAGVQVEGAAPTIRAAAAPALAVDDAAIADAERRLAIAKGYDAVENVSSAFGNFVDDFEWRQLGLMFAKKGAREMPFAGFYIGPERITRAETTKWGPGRRTPRTSIPIHLRIQPLIEVSQDGRSATYRTRLFSIGSSLERAGSFGGGMYPNDQAVLEDGVWKLWNVAIDEFYYNSAGYAGGWARMKEDTAERKPDMLLTAFPPDIPLTVLGKRQQAFRPGTTEFNPAVSLGPMVPSFPSVGPMWFQYKNPVSGRVPPYYWPDCVTCLADPRTDLTNNGY